MDVEHRVQVTDKNGWHKEFELPDRLAYIGSASESDILLEGGRSAGVSLRHVQLVPVQEGRTVYRAVNLGESDVFLNDVALAPRSAAGIADGDMLKLGSYTLAFRLGRSASQIRSGETGTNNRINSSVETNVTNSIGLLLTLPYTTLGIERPIEGSLTVRNQGNMPGARFRFELEGLESDCYDIGPGPILFPHAEKDVVVRFCHPHKSHLSVGDYPILIRATAPEAYPGQSATVSEVIHALPFYRHQLRFIVAGKD